MSRKKFDNFNRKQLRKLNEAHEKLWELGNVIRELVAIGSVDDEKKFSQLRNDLLQQIYEVEKNVKIDIFNFENSHLA